MNPNTWLVALIVVVVGGCKPDVGPPASLIQGPTILAIKGEPAEAKPGQTVKYEALVVDLEGRIAVAGSGNETPLLWSVCDQPKPPIENNSVAVDCLDTLALPGEPGPTPSTYVVPISFDVCQIFGPTQPPSKEGEPPIRARDPDVTGGYYVPIRSSLMVPEMERRPGMATGDSLVAFAHERVFCGIAGVKNQIAIEYMQTYENNSNPILAGLMVMRPGEDFVGVSPVSKGATPLQVGVGKTVRFVAGWTPESVERYPAWDVLSKQLIYHLESFRVSWFATGGEFEHAITGRTESENEQITENTWADDAVGRVHLWLVLHDSRGGVDFQAYDIDVIP